MTITYPAPTADESATALSFGTQAQGTASASQTLTATNNGSAPLIVSGVLVGGSDPGDYLVDDQCRQQVAPGSSARVEVSHMHMFRYSGDRLADLWHVWDTTALLRQLGAPMPEMRVG